MTSQRTVRPGLKVVAAVILLVALVLAGVVSRFASDDPDGLAKVSEDHGFADKATSHEGLLGDYSGLTGVVGVLVVLGLAGGVTMLLRRRRPDHEQS